MPGLRSSGLASSVTDSTREPIHGLEHPVLMLTPTAIEVVRNITSTQGSPEAAGLRIAAAPDAPPDGPLQISVAAAPAENDQVLSGEGSRIFLDQQAAEYLDDKVLDAGIDSDGRATFTLAHQERDAH